MRTATNATDYLRQYFDEAKLHAKDGFRQAPPFRSVYPTKEEFDQQNSRTIGLIMELTGIKQPEEEFTIDADNPVNGSIFKGGIFDVMNQKKGSGKSAE